MEIKILRLIDGAKNARGTTVIIDVFRAMSLEACFYNNGANAVIPIGDIATAYQLKELNPEYVLAGERHGKIVEGFDMGNSPSQLKNINVLGKTIVHTTSAGTQGIDNAIKAEEILGGSLLTAKATAEYIKRKNPEYVSLVCMGLEGAIDTEEDLLCAEYIKGLLEGKEIDIACDMEALKYTSGAKFFDYKQKDVFPTEDFYMCTELNKFNYVLRYNRVNGVMEKIDL